MGFFSPWFLAGIAAAALPLWLHLLRQFKRTPRPFSSLMFFERRVQSSTKHRRLRYLALLSARIALLSLLAVAFANPFVYRKADTVHQRMLIIIAIDRSFSMRASGRMEAAKNVALEILNGLPSGSDVQVIAFDAHTEALTSPSTDRGLAKSAIRKLGANDGASSYGELNRSLRILQQSAGMQLRVHIVTDAQQTSMPQSFGDLRPPPHVSEEIYPVSKTVPNGAIATVNAPARIFGSQLASIAATVRTWNENQSLQKVLLLVDGHNVASREVAVPANGSASVQFDNVSVPYGGHRAEVALASSDDLPNDDRFLFSMERLDPRRVLFLYSSGWAAQAFYYKSALEASNSTGLLVQPAAVERVADENLATYAFVVLHDPGRLDQSTLEKLKEYVQRGGSLLIAVGPSTIAAGRVPILGNEIAESRVSQPAGDLNRQEPATLGMAALQNVEFLQTARVTAIADERVLAHFADGSPLLIEHKSGEGRVLIFASTLDNSASDFPLHTSYLPFVVATAQYLSGQQDVPSSVLVGTPITLRQTREETTAADVIGPEGRHELSISEGTRVMSYEPAREGFYEIQRASGARMLLAVHADRRESDLTSIPRATIELWRNVARNQQDPDSTLPTQTVKPSSLWRNALIIVLIAATFESLLAGRYLRQEEGLHDGT